MKYYVHVKLLIVFVVASVPVIQLRQQMFFFSIEKTSTWSFKIGFQRMQGLSLELCAKDRVGLLAEVTRILRENGLSVRRAGISTVGEEAVNVFYVRDAYGNPVDSKTIESLRREIGHMMMLNVKKDPGSAKAPEAEVISGWAKTSFFFGNLLDKLLA